jgi:hypothetical protein
VRVTTRMHHVYVRMHVVSCMHAGLPDWW